MFAFVVDGMPEPLACEVVVVVDVPVVVVVVVVGDDVVVDVVVVVGLVVDDPAGVVVELVEAAGLVVEVVEGRVVVVVAGTRPGITPFGLVVTVFVSAVDGGYSEYSTPKPTKARAMSTVERRMGNQRAIATDMKPTKALWGTGANSPVGAPVAQPPGSLSASGPDAAGSSPLQLMVLAAPELRSLPARQFRPGAERWLTAAGSPWLPRTGVPAMSEQ